MTQLNDIAFAGTWSSPRGFPGSLAVVNNRPLGIRFMLTALAFFLIGGVLALLMRVQLAVSENTFLGPELYNQLFTMHGSTMMYLFSVPFLEGLALYLLPLMIGSRDVAYPRLSAFAYWTYLFGGIVFYASFFVGKVPDAGWFAYTPLSGSRYAGLGMDFWAVGLGLVEISGIAAGVDVVVTVLKLRAPGMSLERMPVFAWAMLAAGLMSLFAFTTLLVATTMLELDRTAGTQFFNSDRGGTHLLWQHLFWFFGHPEVYIIFLPATGIVSLVVTTFARRLLGYRYIVVAIIVTAFVSFGLWVHHMYTTGLPEMSLNFFAAASLMIALASGAQVFAWIASLWRRRPALSTPMLYVLGFIFIFVLGGMTGVMVAIVPFDWQVHDTYFVVAHFHYVLIGGAVFPIMAGMHYWIPKMTGRMMLPWLGRLSFATAFIGFNMTFFPMHIMGFFGMPRRVYTYSPALELDQSNLFATVGAFVFAAAFGIFLIDLLVSLKWGAVAGDNPWGGDTLEWSVGSPPPDWGFYEPPIVHGRHPNWDSTATSAAGGLAQRATAALRAQPVHWRATLATDSVSAAPQSIHFLAGASYYPLLAAFGLLLASVSILAKVYLVAIVGGVLAIGGVGAWLTPDRHRLAMLRESDVARQAGLPIIVTGSRSIVWCGMVCLLAVLGTALAAMVYAYFYIRLYSQAWPQDGVPEPEWLWFAVAYGCLALTAPMLYLANRGFHYARPNVAQVSLTALMILATAYLLISMYALADYGVSARENAYGSLFYLLTAYPWLLAVVGMALVGNAQARMWSEHEDRTGFMALQLQLASMFWCFVVVTGINVFAILILSP